MASLLHLLGLLLLLLLLFSERGAVPPLTMISLAWAWDSGMGFCIVLESPGAPAYVPMQDAELKWLSLKTAFLLVITWEIASTGATLILQGFFHTHTHTVYMSLFEFHTCFTSNALPVFIWK